jgi:hypothetical protein
MSASFLMVISNGRSPPVCWAGGTHAWEILTASVVAPKSGSACIANPAVTKPAPASAAAFPRREIDVVRTNMVQISAGSELGKTSVDKSVQLRRVLIGVPPF